MQNLLKYASDEDGYDEDETIEAGGPSAVASETGKQTLITTAKELRKRAEKLLGSIAEEDAKDIKDMLEKNREAINAGDMKLYRIVYSLSVQPNLLILCVITYIFQRVPSVRRSGRG